MNGNRIEGELWAMEWTAYHTFVIGITRKRGESGRHVIFEEMVAEVFPNLVKPVNI